MRIFTWSGAPRCFLRTRVIAFRSAGFDARQGQLAWLLPRRFSLWRAGATLRCIRRALGTSAISLWGVVDRPLCPRWFGALGLILVLTCRMRGSVARPLFARSARILTASSAARLITSDT